MATMKIIDVSVHNTITDWSKVKAAGVDGVIIRAGYGKLTSQIDKKFEENYKNAIAAGLLVGAYWYSYAKTAAEAKLEAAACLTVIAGKTFSLPIYFDIEETNQVALGKTTCTAITTTFCNALEKAGYFCGVYSFDSFFGTNLDASIQSRYSCWVARVDGKQPASCTNYGMWQYSWKFSIDGFKGDVDVSYCYKDFASTIKAKGLNGYVNKTYSVTARYSGSNKSTAQSIAESCQQLGMTVVQSEE